MNQTEPTIKVRCPKCNWRICDKVTPTTGIIEMKCPNCRNVISVDLSFRRKSDIKYRMAAYAENIKKIVTTK